MIVMPNISLTATDPNTGGSDTHIFNPEDLVSVTLPFHPAIVNRQLVKSLVSKDWRHTKTGWYNEEHKMLTALATRYPDYQRLIDELRVLLYAVFVKEAEIRHPGRVLTVSYRRFISEYEKFCKRRHSYPAFLRAFGPNTPQGTNDYLRLVSTSSYLESRYSVLFAINISDTTNGLTVAEQHYGTK